MPKPSDSDDTRIKRSTFLKGILGLTIAGVTGKFLYDRYNTLAHVPVRLLGPSMDFGHMVRDGSLKPDPNAPVSKKVKVLIIGGGIAGLSAGWWLKREGMEDFMLLELEGKTGGNSASGENHVSAYPRGAHYIPLANAESTYVRMLFQEFGIIESFDAAGTATYNDLYLCHDPEERLFKDGSFQEGLVPSRGLRPEEKAEIERFFKVIVDFRNKTGSDGKPAFAIPLDLSSRDEEFLSLDRISMEQWLKQNNFSARPLLWYVDYCTRDDYGAKPADVSAWAGIHYFAGRRGRAANAEQNAVVTWPQGNGFVVQKLTEKLASHISTDAGVFHIESRADSVRAAYIDRKSRKTFLIEADHLIFACPRFILPRVLKLDASGNSIEMDYVKKIVYPPWMVANITLRSLPPARGIARAWDNVCYLSDSLGYVVATHQNISTRLSSPTVITYYYPLADRKPDNGRMALYRADPEDWKESIVEDLRRMHPTIDRYIESIELWPWGHGMVSPGLDYIWGETRQRLLQDLDRIVFAHSDMSGISNFEESQYRGVEAAIKVKARLR